MGRILLCAVLGLSACHSTEALGPPVLLEVKPVASTVATVAVAPSASVVALAPEEPVEEPKGVIIRSGTRVLLFGDSMVKAGLGFKLEQLVKKRGGIYLEDYWTSSSTKLWSEGDRLDKLVAKTRPDVVFVVIGSNEVFLMDKRAADNVEKIVSKLEGKPCVWIGPPVWSVQKGIVEIERDHSAPCQFFDSSGLKLERQWDKIHPNTKGGATWATAVWDATVRPPPAG